MSSAALPAAYAALEPWAQRFAKPQFDARYAARVHSSQAELEAFYAALAPDIEAIAAHLDAFPPDALPLPQMRLLQLVLAFMDIAPAVELYHQPTVPLGFDARRAHMKEHVMAVGKESA